MGPQSLPLDPRMVLVLTGISSTDYTMKILSMISDSSCADPGGGGTGVRTP